MKPDSARPRRFWGLTSLVSLVPMKLRSRLIILACVALMPMVVSSAVALAIFLRHEHHTMGRSAVERVRALSTAVDASLKSSATTLEALATSRQLDRPDGLPVFYADAERVLKSQPEWRTINLARPSGEQILNLLRPLGSPLPEVLERPSFDAVIDQRPAPRRVLLVEDNADSREMLKTLLTLEGHEVSEAVDGPSAIEAMAREHPDIAFIDIGLPGIDGYEVASHVRAQSHGADVLLVALTGYGLRADRERSRAAGFDVHLVKPFRPDELKKILTSHKPRSGQPSPRGSRSRRARPGTRAAP